MYILKEGLCKFPSGEIVLLSVAVVEALELKEGDEINIHIAGSRKFEVERDTSRKEALDRLRSRRIPLPAGFKFDREEANER